MPDPPRSSPLPLPVFMPQISLPPRPSPTIAPSTRPNKTGNLNRKRSEQDMRQFDLPKLRLELRDLTHPGSSVFLSSVQASTLLEDAVRKVLHLLYHSPDETRTTVPGTRSVTLILRNIGGVAYTTGSELDDDHKEIHFSVEYITNIDKSRQAAEIAGVVVHEMVHCFQYNARGTCPGGLIEGIADWVRLNCDLSPPHWKREATGKWDAGYQHTGYFLDYLETRYGDGTIRKLNEKLRKEKYEEKPFWTQLLGRPVEQLWDDYAKSLATDKKGPPQSAPSKDNLVILDKPEEPSRNS